MGKKILKILLAILIVIMIIFVSVVLYIQPSFLFYNWHDEESYNKLLTEDKVEEIRIDNNGKLLNGWLKYNTDKKQAPLVIFFGGNAQNSSNTCYSFLKNDIYQYFENYNVMIIDYPGYGLSEGTTSDKTMFNAALKIYDYATTLDSVDEDNIVVLGYSIGTGVATYLSSQRDVNGLILISPYDEALSLYNATFDIFHGPLKLLARYKFNSKDYAQNVTTSPLIITSYDDEVINYNLTLNLAKHFNSVDKTILLNNIKHNDYFLEQEVLTNIHDYLQNRLYQKESRI